MPAKPLLELTQQGYLGTELKEHLTQRGRCQLFVNWLVCAGRAAIKILQQRQQTGGDLGTVTVAPGNRSSRKDEVLVGLVGFWPPSR